MRLGQSLFVLGALALGMSPSRQALACGGTFCDAPLAGQPPMPVDQSGENIIFVLAGGYVEAHIQIQYTGDPERFAWLVPVPAQPEVSVGSQQLFVNVMNATVPTFTLTTTFDACDDSGGWSSSTSSGSGAGCGFGGGDDDSASFDGVGADAGAGEDTVEQDSDAVWLRQAVGAFDVTVLQPASASDVTIWLETNGFLQDEEAPPILEDYVASGHYFVAVKLQPGAGVNEIHPLVVRYAGTAPCIPLKLTSIAATEDMSIRAFFLGDRRVVPTTYRHATLNPAMLDWVNLGANYTSVVSRAVDEPGADGQAFITEYAGTSRVVAETSIQNSAWTSEVFRTLEPVSVIDELMRQGLVSCPRPDQCEALHPLVLPIVQRYLPAPAGMPEGQFYSCLSCNADAIDLAAWDANAFADSLDERVMAPARHAVELLRDSSYVTRLFTTLSPYEMTKDPEFAAASLSEEPVSAALSATQRFTCDGEQVLELQDGREIALTSGGSVPGIDAMPYVEMVEEFDAAGTRTLVGDNSGDIDESISASNDTVSFEPRSWDGGSSRESDDSGGCGCGIPRRQRVPGYTIAAALVLSVLRRRMPLRDRR